MPSELQAVCDALEGVVQPLDGVVRELYSRASRLRAVADDLQGELRQAGVSGSQVVHALLAASSATEAAAYQLETAASHGRDYIQRTARGGGSGLASATDADRVEQGALTESDRHILADYTDSGYVDMNAMLRGKSPLDAGIAKRCVALSKALQKCPAYTGWVQRGTSLDSQQLECYVPGSIICEHGFTSADKGLPFAGNSTFRIYSQNGKSVKGESTYSDREDEVIFERSTRFHVICHDTIGGHHLIVMEEV